MSKHNELIVNRFYELLDEDGWITTSHKTTSRVNSVVQVNNTGLVRTINTTYAGFSRQVRLTVAYNTEIVRVEPSTPRSEDGLRMSF